MPRPEKVQAVEEIKERFDSSNAAFLTEYRGLTVPQQQALRNELRQAGASYKVVKMSLARLAAQDIADGGLVESLIGPTAIAFVDGDPVDAAKALAKFAGENDNLVIKSGILRGDLIAPETVERLSKIESRDVLLSKIAGAAKAPMTNLAGMLQSFTRDAASVLKQLLEKKEAEGPAEEAAPAAAEAAPATDQPADDESGTTDAAAAADDAEADGDQPTDDDAAAEAPAAEEE